MHKHRVTATDAFGAMVVSIIAAVAIVGLVGVTLVDDYSETYSDMLYMSGGILAILTLAYFAMRGWSRFFASLAALSAAPTPGIDSADD